MFISTIFRATSPIFQTTRIENCGHNSVAPLRGMSKRYPEDGALVLRGLQKVHPLMLQLFLAVKNRLWFIGDQQLRLAFEVLMKHRDRFHQLDSLEGFDTRFTEAMMLEHMLAMVLNMVNRYKCLPELIMIHVGASDFSRVTNHQI